MCVPPSSGMEANFGTLSVPAAYFLLCTFGMYFGKISSEGFLITTLLPCFDYAFTLISSPVMSWDQSREISRKMVVHIIQNKHDKITDPKMLWCFLLVINLSCLCCSTRSLVPRCCYWIAWRRWVFAYFAASDFDLIEFHFGLWEKGRK